MLAGELQALQVAFSSVKDPGSCAGKPMTLVSRETLFAQAMNFGRSEGGRPSTSQMTDSGSVRSLDEVGRTSIHEQLAGESVGDGTNARLHVEDRAAAEGFIDDPPAGAYGPARPWSAYCWRAH
jgi:hypothetical protein